MRTAPTTRLARRPLERRARQSATEVQLSLVVPIRDEAPNLAALYRRCRAALGEELRWELVLLDDGSRDGSDELIRERERMDPRGRGVYFARNCGQTTAIRAGIHASRAPLIATLDGDLQND
ncbi:MAG TPA: glycosyltransferase, partial [Planctomycetota bacterium]|nr:glycosyltransferase [Planctomycetota bacterium]